MTSTRSTPTPVPPERPEPAMCTVWRLQIDMTIGYGVLERVLAVIRIRGVQVTSLRYDAQADGRAHAEFDVFDLVPGRLQLLGAQIERITGVKHVAFGNGLDHPVAPSDPG